MMNQPDDHVASRHRSSHVLSKLERECKLAVDPSFHLPRLPGTQLPRRQLISTYYDTAAYDLAHARITLRHRIEQGKKSWQLKIPLGDDRQEVEVADDETGLPPSLRELLILHLAQRKLLPVVTLRVWRIGVLVRHRRLPVAEVVLDSVTVMKHGSVIQRFRELEIEQRQGDEASLRSLERQLRDAGASDYDGRPKFFRALSLPAPTPATPPEPEAPAVDHLKWTLAQHVGWLIAHDPGTRLGTERESLHQMRVATRRLRAVLRAAAPILLPAWGTALLQELEWLSELLGPARDLDVQIAYFEQEAAGLGARDRKLLAQFLSHLRAQRDTVQQIVRSELTSARYLELIRRLQQAAQDPSVVESPHTVRQLANREFKKLRKAISLVGPSPSDAQLHKVRIKAKRARYAAELARCAVGKPAIRFMKAAQAVQDALGVHQDAIQAELHVRQFLKYSTSVRAGFVAGRMVERQQQRRKLVRQEMKPLFKRLLKRGKKAWG
jgi:CHAD domain-containing protein